MFPPAYAQQLSSGQMEKYASAEFAAWAFAFALGKVATAGTGPYTHTITPLDVVADGIDLPAFSFIETIRQGANDILDRMAVGCCVEDVALTIASGPGRANSKIVANFVGCGKLIRPSGIVIPAVTAENLLPSASLALSVNGTDYVTTKRVINLELQWKNNIRLDTGFYPGSGFQTLGDPDSGAIRGRMEHGKRTLSLRFSARFEDGSSELATLENQSEGTAVLTLSGPSSTSLEITLPRTRFRAVRVDNTDGIVSAETDVLPMMHAANGLVTVEAVNTLATVG